MFGRGSRKEGWSGVASMLAAFALVLQALVAAPCAQAEPAPAAGHEHCQEAVGGERSDKTAPAKAAADACCKCLAPLLAAPPAPPTAPALAACVVAPCGLAVWLDAPTLRAIAEGPPSQAPPVSI